MGFSGAAQDRQRHPAKTWPGALDASPAALLTWKGTTALARVDWIHWVESAKQAATRKRRIANACEMLSEGHKRVCCFDPSGFYSKSLSAPQAAD